MRTLVSYKNLFFFFAEYKNSSHAYIIFPQTASYTTHSYNSKNSNHNMMALFLSLTHTLYATLRYRTSFAGYNGHITCFKDTKIDLKE